MKKYEEVKSLLDFGNYQEFVASQFIENNHERLQELIKEEVKKAPFEVYFSNADTNATFIRCPKCRAILANGIVGGEDVAEYRKSRRHPFVCSVCDHSVEESSAFFKDGILSYSFIRDKNIPTGNVDMYSYETFYNVYDYVPGELVLMGDMYYTLLTDVRKLDRVLNDEDSTVEDFFRELDESEISGIFDYSVGGAFGRKSLLSISKKYGYRLLTFDNNRPALINSSMRDAYRGDSLLSLNLFDIDKKDIDEICEDVSSIERYERHNLYASADEEDDDLLAEDFVKLMLENELLENTKSIYFYFQLLDFKKTRDLSKDGVGNILRKKLGFKAISKLIEDVKDELGNSDLSKAINGDSPILVNVNLKNEREKREDSGRIKGTVKTYEAEYLCLNCLTHDKTEHTIDSFDYYSFDKYPTVCSGCGQAYDVNFEKLARMKDNAKDLHEGEVDYYILNSIFDYRYKSEINVLTTVKVDDLYGSLSMSFSYDIKTIKEEDIKDIISGEKKFADFIVLKHPHMHMAITDITGLGNKIDYYYLHFDGRSVKYVKNNYSNSKEYSKYGEKGPFECFKIDFIHNTELFDEIVEKAEVNKYGSLEYFIKNITPERASIEDGLDFYKYVHFFPKGYPSLININKSYELIMKDPSFVEIFRSNFTSLALTSKADVESLLDKKATKSSEALRLKGIDINIINEYRENENVEDISLKLVKIMNLYKKIVIKVSESIGLEPVYSYQGFRLIVEEYSYGMSIDNALRSKHVFNDYYSGLSHILRILNIDLNSAVNYLDGLYLNQGIKAREGLNIWIDYIEMAIKLDYDLTKRNLIYPNSLKREHDKSVMLFNKISSKLLEVNFKEVVEKNKHLEGQYEEYSFILPESSSDVVSEGMNLNHCVGSYVDRISKGSTLVLFMRLNDELYRSFYTIEVRDDVIIQVRGMSNNLISAAKPSANKELQQWAKDKNLKFR